ncbi:MAG: winged helix DNA-binding protein [Sediminibacterium sp.]|jgi:MarR family transcriptional regulator, lower aerobic nicotinate degradation pathway regulator|nr:winged helix DNA-binding protein [Sediminibacterium sp.]MBX9781265.1 MarR family transcriptional regulator [Chitinophagaceae bacterium]
MERFEILKLLVAKLDDYYTNSGNPKEFDSFVIWLNMQLAEDTGNDLLVSLSRYGRADEITTNSVEQLDNSIGVLNGLMYRYSRIYSKIALDYSSKISLEEFSFLATLSTYEGCTKTELINQMIFEKSTGIELIKRLIKNGLAKEEINPSDKRSKLIFITDKGKGTLYGAFGQMELVSKAITSCLDNAEKKALHFILAKLENHHRLHLSDNLEMLNKKLSRK